MKLFVLTLYAFFLVMPVYLFSSVVMPALQDMNDFYSHMDETANGIITQR